MIDGDSSKHFHLSVLSLKFSPKISFLELTLFNHFTKTLLDLRVHIFVTIVSEFLQANLASF